MSEIEVRREWQTQSESIGKLALALSKAQGGMHGAAKTSKNPFFKSNYADLNECIQATREPLSKNELAVMQTTDSEGSGVWVITTLTHSSGEWIRGRILMTPKKNDDQGRGSSVTYGRRYGYSAIVGLAQKDDDGNASVGKTSKGSPVPSTGLAELELIVDKCRTVDDLIAVYKANETAIKALSKVDNKKIMLLLSQMKEVFIEENSKPATVKCPESGREMVKDDCLQSECANTCAVLGNKPESKLEMNV